MSCERKVLAVGSALVDVLMTVDDSFLSTNVHGAKGGMELVESAWQQELIAQNPNDITVMAGGAAGNTVFGLARLGLKSAMLSKICDDKHGDFYRQSFAKLGGYDDEFIITDKANTGCCISMITPDTQRTMRSYLGASQLVTVEELEKVDFSKYELVYIEGYQLFIPNVVESVCKLAKAAGAKVAIDLASFEVVNIFHDHMVDLIKNYIDIVFANEDEAKALLGAELSEMEMVKTLATWSKIGIVKLGERGSLIASGDEIFEIEPNLVKAIDTTGAGDMWASGFLFGYLTGKELSECGRLGSIVAAEVVQQIGTDITEESWQKIESLI